MAQYKKKMSKNKPQDESAYQLSTLSNVDYTLIINLCKVAPLSSKDLLDFYFLTGRFPTIQEFEYVHKYGFYLLIIKYKKAILGACKKELSPPKSSMYIDIDSTAHISLYRMTADEAMRLSLLIDSGERHLLNGPLIYIGEQLYLYANKAFERMAQESNPNLNVGDK